jgi:hypothetical protein
MEHTLEHRIRERAYEIWSADGQVDGKAYEHWLAAEREVLSCLGGRSPPKSSGARKTRNRTRASSRTVPEPRVTKR